MPKPSASPATQYKLRLPLAGAVGAEPNTAAALSASLAAAEPGDTVLLAVHSPGGSVMEGWAMMSEIAEARKRGVKIHATITGVAASMAAYVLLACERITMSENALLGIHAPSTSAQGGQDDLTAAAATLGKIAEMVAAGYTARIADPAARQRVLAALASTQMTWFSAREALSLGLVDELVAVVYSSAPAAPAPTSAADAAALFSLYSGPAAPATAGAAPASLSYSTTPPTTVDMDTKLMAATLGLPNTADDAAVLAALSKLKADHDAAVAAKAKAEASLQAANDQLAEMAVNTAISAAVVSGKLTDEQAKRMRSWAKTDLDGFNAYVAALPAPAADAARPGFGQYTPVMTFAGGQATAQPATAVASMTDDEKAAAFDKAFAASKLGRKHMDDATYDALFEAKFGTKPQPRPNA